MTICIILAAGQGTRLRPYTNNLPKCFVKLLGRSLIEYQLETLKAIGIKNIVIVTGHASSKFNRLKESTVHNKDFQSTNMVASLMLAIAQFEEFKSDLIIAYSDIVYQSENIRALLHSQDDINVLTDDNWLKLWSLRNENPLDDAETVKFHDKNKIIEIGKKAKDLSEIESQFIGLIKVRHSKVKDLLTFHSSLNTTVLYDGKSVDEMYMTSFIQALIEDDWDIRSTRINGGWLEIDTVSDLELYHSLHKKGKLSKFWRHVV